MKWYCCKCKEIQSGSMTYPCYPWPMYPTITYTSDNTTCQHTTGDTGH